MSRKLYTRLADLERAESEGDATIYVCTEKPFGDWVEISRQPAASGGPVAHVSECEACFTPDACQLRGTCDHYAAEKLRIAATAHPAPARVTAADAVEALDNLDDYARMPCSVDPTGARTTLERFIAQQPAPALVPLTDAQIKRAVEAGWLAALKCHAEAGMAGWSAEREAYIANAIEAAHCIPAPDARVPLTLRQISDATHDYGHVRSDCVIAIARAIEAAHGITAPGAPDAQKSEPEKSPETLSHTDLLQLRGNL